MKGQFKGKAIQTQITWTEEDLFLELVHTFYKGNKSILCSLFLFNKCQ